jgi:TPR repeat protein
MNPHAPRRGLAAGRVALALALLLAPAAVGATQTEREAQFAVGVRAYDAGNYAVAAEAWLPLARNDDPAAQRNLAHLYRRGLGVPQDFGEAAKWYERAAEIGLASAQVNLALMYIRGQGVDQDYTRAAEWLDLAARQGHVLGQYNLALLYWRGLGVEKSQPRALGWLYLAARAGHRGALEKLGQIVQELPGPAAAAKQRQATAPGDTGKPAAAADTDKPESSDADNDDGGALGALARLFSTGDDGATEDEVEDPAVAALGRNERLEVGRAAFLNGDYAHARKMWIDLARRGDGEAQYLMGSLYGEPRYADGNRAESYRWYYLASLNGHAGAIEALQQLERRISDDDKATAMALVRGEAPPKRDQ